MAVETKGKSRTVKPKARRESPAAKRQPVASRIAPVSLPPRPDEQEHLDLRIWLRLLACATRLEGLLRTRFTREFDITLARFDLLAQLDRAGGALTMTDASRRMMVSNGAITSLVDKLVQEGFVTRESHPDDRRTTIVRLTEKGRADFLEMAGQHEQWIISMFEGLPKSAKTDLLRGLGELKHRIDVLEGE